MKLSGCDDRGEALPPHALFDESPRNTSMSAEPEDLRRTALDSVHRALGATMTGFAGWDMPLRYGS